MILILLLQIIWFLIIGFTIFFVIPFCIYKIFTKKEKRLFFVIFLIPFLIFTFYVFRIYYPSDDFFKEFFENKISFSSKNLKVIKKDLSGSLRFGSYKVNTIFELSNEDYQNLFKEMKNKKGFIESRPTYKIFCENGEEVEYNFTSMSVKSGSGEVLKFCGKSGIVEFFSSYVASY